MTPHLDQTSIPSLKFVIPVRYVVAGAIVQTTSTALNPQAIHVRSVRPPRTGLVIGLKLYLPTPGDMLTRTGLVAETTAGPDSGFWAEFGAVESGSDRIAALLARHRDLGDRGCPRFHAHLPVMIRKENRNAKGHISNISRSGAFVKLAPLPPLGTIVDLEFVIPGARRRETVVGYVVHVAERRGVGVQFIGGSDEFRARLDEYVERLAAG